MTKLTYRCGHESNLADHTRGKNRQSIVATVEAMDCQSCRLRKQAAKLTRVDGTPYTHAEQIAYVNKRTRLVD